ncbi:MAG: hypothetical protein HQ461_01435 [Deltaproteobacteria bacterium]|nr:hypothetical protein [Deltaproteobacteria bacterium]
MSTPSLSPYHLQLLLDEAREQVQHAEKAVARVTPTQADGAPTEPMLRVLLQQRGIAHLGIARCRLVEVIQAYGIAQVRMPRLRTHLERRVGLLSAELDAACERAEAIAVELVHSESLIIH